MGLWDMCTTVAPHSLFARIVTAPGDEADRISMWRGQGGQEPKRKGVGCVQEVGEVGREAGEVGELCNIVQRGGSQQKYSRN